MTAGSRPSTVDGRRGMPPPRVADRRGLTAAGGAVLLTVLGGLGAGLDVVTGRGLGTFFAICFVVGCALAAVTVHREDLKAVIVMPPLVYALLALVVGAVEGSGGGSFLRGQAVGLANALVLGAPVLVAGFLTALVLAGVRLLGARSA